ncbi:sulfotransferase family 2 domain-containing protein [Pantoea sp. LMR881]|uniref:sulfotransferase family 2 domain-containing protein n=1 Tax=Pantoea sp. LMR881 TaxID=3014336 RepID=UPI0022AF1BF4|nr:sulfotransferase family 2 domain-containing protein [Pantoea sp. LMR881]MCZ4060750.1 sulfotransferase family 2 domain-containing protein [Pantoea sp. LMR881]
MSEKDYSPIPENFDEKLYLALNPDVRLAGMDAKEHYQKYGRSEQRPYQTAFSHLHCLPEDFNSLVYLALNPDVKNSGMNAAEHYLQYGINEKRCYSVPGVAPLPDDFDPELYREMYSDIVLSNSDPVLHYLKYGRSEGRIYNFNFHGKRAPDTKPIFFLHIPKTAGSSFNKYVSEKMVCVEHIESKPAIYTEVDKNIADFDFVSAHIDYKNPLSIIRNSSWFRFTFLRDPIAQTVSHLKWVRSFGTDERAHERHIYTEEENALFARLQSVTLNDVDTLNVLFESCAQFRKYFDNCQVRYLSNADNDRIDEQDFIRAISNTKSLDYIAFCETAAEDSLAILNAAGWQTNPDAFPVTNLSPSKEMPDFSNTEILAFYQKLTRYDQRLYDMFKQLRKSNLSEGEG